MSAPAAKTPGVVECTISTQGWRAASASAESSSATMASSRALRLPGPAEADEVCRAAPFGPNESHHCPYRSESMVSTR